MLFLGREVKGQYLLPEKLSSIQNGQDRIGFMLELEEDCA